ncbi:hypothetical protein ANCDUO_24132 [Ancylostoma duodenale]|uniref:Uncharacterized protein n=1 Tax=Ancylostoma duodenale TaxID=51022 RepID=A0A0C2BPV9_9BILA|nr:hypothetical protein ANCDUO_24132 [Ancylostoma duodenale]
MLVSLAILPDGSKFLQFRTPTFRMYYSKETIKKALDNRLYALVADGIHKVLPRKLGGNAQTPYMECVMIQYT